MSGEAAAARSMLWFFQGVIGYEWLISGLDKVFNHQFVIGLHAHLMHAMAHDAYPPYVPFLRLFLPYSHWLAASIEVSEVLVGAAMLTISGLGFLHCSGNAANWLGLTSNLTGLFLTGNFFFNAGASYFFTLDHPFDEGVSLDFLLGLMQAAFVTYYLRTFCASRGSGQAPRSARIVAPASGRSPLLR